MGSGTGSPQRSRYGAAASTHPATVAASTVTVWATTRAGALRRVMASPALDMAMQARHQARNTAAPLRGVEGLREGGERGLVPLYLGPELAADDAVADAAVAGGGEG